MYVILHSPTKIQLIFQKDNIMYSSPTKVVFRIFSVAFFILKNVNIGRAGGTKDTKSFD